MESRIEITVPSTVVRVRLEDFLLDHFSGLSKMYLRDVVKVGACEVNGRTENIGYRLRPKDLIEIVVDQTRRTAMRADNIPLDIVFEDADIIVVNKPAGMLTHPSHRENSGTLLNALVFYLNKSEPPAVAGGLTPSFNNLNFVNANLQPPATAGGSDKIVRPGLPHRLDKETSGLIVIAKNAHAHRSLSNSFMKKRVEKKYLALVEGVMKEDQGVIEAPIGRYADIKHWSVKEDGKHSESRFRVRERYSDATLIELEPVTGRTNQLRIHCELIGHPIVGDVKRGGREFDRLCLHAYQLSFPHPATREICSFTSEISFR